MRAEKDHCSKARTGPARPPPNPGNSRKLRRVGLRCAGELLKARTGPARPHEPSGTRLYAAESGSLYGRVTRKPAQGRLGPPTRRELGVSRPGQTRCVGELFKIPHRAGSAPRPVGNSALAGRVRLVVRASYSKARTGPARPPDPSGTRRQPAGSDSLCGRALQNPAQGRLGPPTRRELGVSPGRVGLVVWANSSKDDDSKERNARQGSVHLKLRE